MEAKEKSVNKDGIQTIKNIILFPINWLNDYLYWSFFVLSAVLVYLLPQHTSCNISSQITLVCTVKAKNSSELSNEWVHVRDNTVLRSLKGHIKGSTSKLSVHYCDYRDAGKYICKWSTKEKVYSNQSTVLVEGIPVYHQ